MEEEIDLRQYIAILIKYWYWIVGLAIVAAVVAFVVSSFIPPTYEATALVTVSQPRYQLQFDERFQNIPEWGLQQLLQSQYRTYPTLATSSDLLQQLAQQTGWDVDDLKNAAQANGGNELGLLALTVKGKDAEEVANVANTWAELIIKKVNALYGNGQESEEFNQRQQLVALSLADIDAALTAFREENGFGFIRRSDSESDSDRGSHQFGLIGQRLESKNGLLTDYETELVRLHQMQREVELLSETVTTDTSPVLIAGLLSEMINIGVVEDTQIYQINLDSVDPSSGLKAMDKALESRITAIEAETDTLREEIAALQAELAAKHKQLEQLIRERDVTEETYQILSRKVQETHLEAASDERAIQIAGRATPPTKPTSPRRLLNTVVAGALGLMIGVIGVFALEWWREDKA